MKFSRKSLIELRNMRAQIDRMLSLYGMPEPSTGDAPDHYIVKAPAEAIGGAIDPDPTATICTISRRWGAASPRAIEDTARKLTVYNRGGILAPDSYAAVHKDPWGDYYVEMSETTHMLIQAPVGGIPARVDETPGNEDCFALIYDAANTDLLLTDYSVTVYNWLTSVVCSLGDRLGWVKKVGGYWWVIADDCNDTSSTTFPTF